MKRRSRALKSLAIVDADFILDREPVVAPPKQQVHLETAAIPVEVGVRTLTAVVEHLEQLRHRPCLEDRP
ncbi:MAG: hypothetical protein QGH45_19770, partial [Myxococcota bacterium]|nr:hypothetical protein [Myxococcota bacterium]